MFKIQTRPDVTLYFKEIGNEKYFPGQFFKGDGTKGRVIGILSEIKAEQIEPLIEKVEGGYKFYHTKGQTGDPKKVLTSIAYSFQISNIDFFRYVVIRVVE